MAERFSPDGIPGRKTPAKGVKISLSGPNLVLLTVNTKDRVPWLTQPAVHTSLREIWCEADAWLVGDYLLMPDHLHLFCAPHRSGLYHRTLAGVLEEPVQPPACGSTMGMAAVGLSSPASRCAPVSGKMGVCAGKSPAQATGYTSGRLAISRHNPHVALVTAHSTASRTLI